MLAKQVLSQLSYTPTAEAILILKHFLPFRNPVLRIFVISNPCLSDVPRSGRLLTYGNPFQSFEGVGIFAN